MEPPVPAGLGKLPRELMAVADFYELSDVFLQEPLNSRQSYQRHRMRVIQ